MKTTLMLTVLLCLVCFLSCDDIVIGEYPIMKIDDTVIVCPLPDDYYHVALYRSGAHVSVSRPYDDQTTIEFHEYYNGEILHVTIVKRPADQD